MGLEVSLIFALAEGNFHIRKMKKATFGTSSEMSQKRTLRRQHGSLQFCTHLHRFGTILQSFQTRCYLESPMSSYRTCRHRWGLVILDWGSGCHVGSADVFSRGEGETLPLYDANLTAEVTVANMVSEPKGRYQTTQTNPPFQLMNAKYFYAPSGSTRSVKLRLS